MTPHDEFTAAMKALRKRTGKYFPSWAQTLDVIERLGYRRPGTGAEDAFRSAMTAWKTETGIRFPTWGQVFGILTGIGYVRTPNAA